MTEDNNLHRVDSESAATKAEPAEVLAHEPIERLREMGRALGAEIPGRIIQLYLNDAPQKLLSLRQSVLSGDAEAGEQAAHSLTGSSANLGAQTFADLCRDVERRCRGGESELVEGQLSILQAEYERVEKAMRHLLTEFA